MSKLHQQVKHRRRNSESPVTHDRVSHLTLQEPLQPMTMSGEEKTRRRQEMHFDINTTRPRQQMHMMICSLLRPVGQSMSVNPVHDKFLTPIHKDVDITRNSASPYRIK